MSGPSLPFTTTWTGAAGDGQWSNASNWSDGVPFNPGTLSIDQQDVAIIDNSVLTTPFTVTIAGNQFIQDLTLDVTNPLNGPAASLTGTLDAAWNEVGFGANFGNIELQAGTFEIDGGTLDVANVNEDGGTLAFGAYATFGASVLNAVEINGPLTIGNTSDVVVAPSSFIGIGGNSPNVITIVQDSTLSMQSNIYLQGTINVDSGLLLLDGGQFLSDPGTVDIEIGANGTLAAIGNVPDNYFVNSTLGNTLIDGNWTIGGLGIVDVIAGDTLTVEAQGGAAPANLSLSGFSFLDIYGGLVLNGTADVSGASGIDINGSLQLNGSIDLSGGATSGGGNNVSIEGSAAGGTITDDDTGNGQVIIDPVGTATIAGITIAAQIQMQGTNGGPTGTLLAEGNDTFGDDNPNGNTVVDLGGGTLLVAGTLSLLGVTLQDGTVVVLNGGSLVADAASQLNVTMPGTQYQDSTWTGGGGDGLWSDASNWSSGVPYNPLALSIDQQDIAVIDNSVVTSPYTVTIDGQEFVQDLTLNAENPLGAPALSLTGTLTAAWNTLGGGGTLGSIDIEQGDFEVDGGTLVAASVTLNGGSISFGAYATYGAAVLQTSGINESFTIGNTSEVVAAPNTFVIFGDGNPEVVSIDQASTLSAQGGVYLNGTSDIEDGVLSLAGGSLNGNGGVTTIVENGGTLLDNGGGTLNNATIEGNWAIAADTVVVAANSTTTIESIPAVTPIGEPIVNTPPAILTIDPAGTLDVEGTLDLAGTIDGGTVYLNGTVTGDPTLGGTIAGGTLTIAAGATVTLNDTTVLSNIVMGAGAELSLTGDSTLGGSTASSVNLDGGTILVTDSLNLDNVTVEDGVLSLGTGATFTQSDQSSLDNVAVQNPSAGTGSSSLYGQNVTLTQSYDLQPGDTLSVETGVNGPDVASGTPGSLTVPSGLSITGAGLVSVTDANGPSTSVVNGLLLADVSGQDLQIQSDSIALDGLKEAINGGTLQLGSTSATDTSGGLLGGNPYAQQFGFDIQAGSTILLDNWGSITAIGGVITLNGTGAELAANNGGDDTPLEDTLQSVGGLYPDEDTGFAGVLNLLNGEDFQAQNTLTNYGTIILQDATISAPAIIDQASIPNGSGLETVNIPTIIANGLIDAPLSGGGLIIASGGTLELTGSLAGYETFEAANNASLLIDQPLPGGANAYSNLILLNSATIMATGTVSNGITFAGTDSTLDLSGITGGTIVVQGQTLTSDAIDVVGLAAATDGTNPDIAITRQNNTLTAVTIYPASDPGSAVVVDITGNFSTAGVTAGNDGNGGTLIQFGTVSNAANPVIEGGTGLTAQAGIYLFTAGVHQRIGEGTDPSATLLIENSPNSNPLQQGTLGGSVGPTDGDATATGSFMGITPGSDTDTGFPPATGIPITVTLDTQNIGLATGDITLHFTSTAIGTNQAPSSQLPDKIITLQESVYALGLGAYPQTTFYIQPTDGAGTKTFNLPVTDNGNSDGFYESLIAGVAGDSGDLFSNGSATGATGTIAAGTTNTTGISFTVDTNVNDFADGLGAVQTGTIDLVETSDGDGIDQLGTTALGTIAVPISVQFIQLATAYAQAPQIFYIPAAGGFGSGIENLAITVSNVAEAGVSSNLIASVIGFTGDLGNFGSNPNAVGTESATIVAGASDSSDIAFEADTNQNDVPGGVNGSETGDIMLGLVSQGTAGYPNTDLGTIDVPVTVFFDGPAIPSITTNYYTHETAPNETQPSTTTLKLVVANIAQNTGHSESLVANIASSAGAFSIPTPGIQINPGTITPAIAPGGTSTAITFQVVTDGDVVDDDGGVVDTGTFNVDLTSTATSALAGVFGNGVVNTSLGSEDLGINVTIVGYTSPIIDGFADPVTNLYNPSNNTPLHETLNLGTVAVGSYIDHIVTFQNVADDPSDSLGINSNYFGSIIGVGAQYAPIDPGNAFSVDGFDAGGTYNGSGFTLGPYSQVVEYDPISENPTSNTPLTPVDITYTWTVVNQPRAASAWGDVHLTTFDGLAYSFQAEGEFILAKSTEAGNSFQVQIRLEPPAGAQVTLITDIGIQVGSDVATFETGRNDLVYINGAPSSISANNAVIPLNGGSLTYIDGTYRVAWNTGESMQVTDSGTYLNIYNLTLGPNDGANSVEGLLGPANNGGNDFELANGTYLPVNGSGFISSTDLYGAFANSWRVSQATSLLDYTIGQTTTTFTDTNFPADAVSLTDLPSAVQSEALAAAVAAGITDPVLQQQAAEDYALTGDTSFLDSGANAQQQNQIVTAAGVTESTPASPGLGVAAATPSQTEATSGQGQVTFTVYLTSGSTLATVVDYAVTAPGAGYLGASAFGGILPSGTVTIPIGSTSAAFNIDVPAGALGSDVSDTVQVSISTPGSNPIITASAQTALINSSPVAGSPPVPELALLSNIGSAVSNNGTLTVGLGNVIQGQAINPLQFQIANAATGAADNLAGSLSDLQLPPFTMLGTTVPTPIAPGDVYQGLDVSVNTATLGAGNDTITYAPIDENASGYSASLPSQSILLSDTVIAAAQPLLNSATSYVFAPVHVGATPADVLSISNTATSGSASLDVSLGIVTGGYTANGQITQLAPGQTDNATLSISENTGAGGPYSGIATLTYTSDAGDGETLAAGTGTIDVSGGVFRFAQAAAPSPIYLELNSPGTVAESLSNIAAADRYSENLTGSVAGTSDGIITSGTIGEIAAGGTSTSLSLIVPTAIAGSGTVTLDLISDGGAIDGLGTTAIGNVTQQVYIDNPAIAAIDEVSGGGTLVVNGSTTTLNLGNLAQASGLDLIQLDLRNAATGQADLLSGQFGETGSSAFTNNGFATVPTLVAGATDITPQISLSTTQLGTFSESITFDATGSNPSGYSADLGTQSFIVTGTVLAAPTITALTPTPSTGTVAVGQTITIAATVSDPVVVAGTPTLSLDDGGSATYVGGSGTGTLLFTSTVLSGQQTPDLAATGLNLTGASIDDASSGLPLDLSAFNGALTSAVAVACFLPGTLIRTDHGEIAVEKLLVGDIVITLSGRKRPLCWIGRGTALAARWQRGAATPIIVRRGALADNVPYADLRITKGHSLYIDGVLIPAEFLVNHRSIEWDDRAQEVTVFHLELDAHDVLIANGAAAESYRDDGNRWLFRNANSGWDQGSKPPCAPVLTGGPIVDAIWKRILERSGPRPGVPLTDDPDLHLIVDRQRLDAAQHVGKAYVFALPDRPESIRIASRSVIPQERGFARDPRTLGVALRRIAIQRGADYDIIKAGDIRLADGFHGFEAETGLRWTAGNAVLPAALLNGCSGPMEIVVTIGQTTLYIEDDVQRQVA